MAITKPTEWVCERPDLGVAHAFYKTGPLGLRGDNFSMPVSGNQRLIFALGCSVTYGVYVGEESTLPAQLAFASGGRFRVLNLGVGGGGLQNAMAALSDAEFYLKEAKAKSAPIAVYTFIYSHPARFAQRSIWKFVRPFKGEPNPIRRDDGKFFDAGDTLSRKLARFTVFKLETGVFYFLIQTYFKSFEQAALHASFDKDLDLFADGIREMAAEFYTRFPEGILILNYWEHFPWDTLTPRFLDKLGKIDPRIILVRTPATTQVPRLPDGHPDADGYGVLARSLNQEIQKILIKREKRR